MDVEYEILKVIQLLTISYINIEIILNFFSFFVKSPEKENYLKKNISESKRLY